ncbi:hypothetical protein SRABI118_03877 [Massilia sp. Bi118]|nr:hypothetical protein SRABI118_03877 [Massilia sp. Bi118]
MRHRHHAGTALLGAVDALAVFDHEGAVQAVAAQHADREHVHVHQLAHLAVDVFHDRFAVQVGREFAADVGQQRDVAARLQRGFLLLLGSFLLQDQFGGAGADGALQPFGLLHQHANAQAVDGDAGADDGQRAQQAEPPGHPERRRDVDGEACRGVAPQPVLVGGADLEHVMTRVQVGISSEALAGVGFGPVAVEALQAVGEAVALRVGEVQGRELQREHGIAVRQLDPVRHARAVRQARTVLHQEVGDDRLRGIGIVAHRVRHEGGHAVGAAEVQLAVGALRGRADEIRTVQQAVLRAVALEFAGGRVDTGQAHGGADPEFAAAVFEDAADRHRLVRVRHREIAEHGGAACVALHPVQAGGGADPDLAAARLVQIIDAVVAQRGRVLVVVAEMREGAAGAVEAVQAVVGAEPDIPGAVLEQREAVVLAQAPGVERVVAPGAQGAAIRVEQEQAAARRHPQVAGAVEQQVLDVVRR